MTPIGRGNQNSQGPYGHQPTQGETDPLGTIQSLFAASTSIRVALPPLFPERIEAAVKKHGGPLNRLSVRLGLSRSTLLSDIKHGRRSVLKTDFSILDRFVSGEGRVDCGKRFKITPDFREKIRRAIEKERFKNGRTVKSYDTLSSEIQVSKETLHKAYTGDRKSFDADEQSKMEQFVSKILGSEDSKTPSFEGRVDCGKRFKITPDFREKIRRAIEKERFENGNINGRIIKDYATLSREIHVFEGTLYRAYTGDRKSFDADEQSKMDQFVSKILGSEGSKTPSLEKKRKPQDLGNQRSTKRLCSLGNSELSCNGMRVGVPQNPPGLPNSNLDGLRVGSSCNSFKETTGSPERASLLEAGSELNNDFPSFDYALVSDVNFVGVLQQPVGSSGNPLEGMPGSPALDLVLQDYPAKESSAEAAKVRTEPANSDVNFVGVLQQPVGSSDNPFEEMPGSPALELALAEEDPNQTEEIAAVPGSEPTNNGSQSLTDLYSDKDSFGTDAFAEYRGL